MNVIVLIYEYEPLFTDGRTIRMKCFAEFVRDQGADVTLIHLSDIDRETSEAGIRKIGIGYPGMSALLTNQPAKSGRTVRKRRELLRRLSRLAFPDRYLFAARRVSRKIKQIAAPGDVLVVSMPLFSPLIVFAWKALTPIGLDIVFDYRDLWVNNKIFVGGKLRNLIAEWIEMKALSQVYGVMVTTEPAKRYFAGKGLDNVWLVRNGISLKDYEYIQSIRKAGASRNLGGKTSVSSLAIGYFGNIGNRRSCEPLFRELKRLGVDLRVYGNIDETHRMLCGDSFKGAVARTEALREAAQCDLLIVVIRASEDSSNAMPGKIFEYMSLGIPMILYCPPDSLIADWISQYRYPHLLIDSEAPAIGIAALADSLMRLSGQIYEPGSTEESAIPIREKEFQKFLTDIEIAQNQ